MLFLTEGHGWIFVGVDEICESVLDLYYEYEKEEFNVLFDDQLN